MNEVAKNSFTHILVGDVTVAENRMRDDDTPSHRRELVRAVFAAVEGLLWQLKQDVLEHAKDQLSHHEHAAMTEETYSVDARGSVNPTPRFLPLTTSIRLVVCIVKRYRPTYNLDFGHIGWANLKDAVEVRNRLVHPKRLEDFSVSDEEIRKTLSGFAWMLALVIEVLRETHIALAGHFPPPATS